MDWKRSGRIPVFGDWDHANELPITQYFECAREAGLFRHSSLGECGHHYMRDGHLFAAAADIRKLSDHNNRPPTRKTRWREKRGPHDKNVCSIARPKLTVRPPKPVDEDLYKIPPELLRSSKRKIIPGLFSCLVTSCAS